jgi:murein DD-endopeptidase MepM/ murein hydrolase activator NlpD
MDHVAGGFAEEEEPTVVVITRPLFDFEITPLTSAAGLHSGLAGDIYMRTPDQEMPLDDEEDEQEECTCGADVNGDGIRDYMNPVDGDRRTGAGDYHARRAVTKINPQGLHWGQDYLSQEGEEVLAPVNGIVSKKGNANNSGNTYVEIETADGTTVRVLYVSHSLVEGDTVTMGSVIGTTQDITQAYANTPNHIHIQIKDNDGVFVDPRTLVDPNRSNCPIHG